MKIRLVFIATLFAVTFIFSANSFADESKPKTFEDVMIQGADDMLLQLEMFKIKTKSDQLSKVFKKNVVIIMETEFKKMKFQRIADTTENAELKTVLESGIKKVEKSLCLLEGVQADIEKEMADLLKKAEDLVVKK